MILDYVNTRRFINYVEYHNNSLHSSSPAIDKANDNCATIAELTENTVNVVCRVR